MDNFEPSNFQQNMMSLRNAMNNLVHDAMQDSLDMWSQWDLPGHAMDIMDAAKGHMGMAFPRVDMRDNGEAIVIKADIPGVDPEDLEIEIDDDAVYIMGVTNYESEDDDADVYQYERHYGSFERMVPLPAEIDFDRAIGQVEHGTLTLTLPHANVIAAPKKASKKKAAPKKATAKKKAPAKKPTTKKKAPTKTKAVAKKKAVTKKKAKK